LGALAGLCLPASANPNLITNGLFQDGGGGSFTDIGSPNTFAMGAWTVTAGTVDWIGGYWTAPVGYSVDLNGENPGAITQSNIATVNGQEYQLTFYLAANPDGGRTDVKTATVTADSAIAQFTATPVASGEPTVASGWTLYSMDFTAGAGTSTVTFTGDPNAGPYGPVVADVSLTAVPEPGVYGVLAIGLSGVFLFVRRDRRA
jgi:choice-of-anchor C domain-containing protein